MFFDSVSYAFFLPIVFLLYWLVINKNFRAQNALLLVAGYFFYSCWDVRFTLLLLTSTLIDYFSGLKIFHSQSNRKKKSWLAVSILVNLGLLGFFKYYNFFTDSFSQLLSRLGMHSDAATLSIILPIGISFYTFHGLSYIIDVYKNKIPAESNFINYSVFVSFFPLLVAGPIERATHLLPQIQKERQFNYGAAVDGLRQILWGLFKKVVIADQCSVIANLIFNDPQQYSASTLLMGAVIFAFQVYADFSGYTDIALGSARLLGFELLQNFSYPFFSRNLTEFWRRWHISLSGWFRDYLYIPLGGSKKGKWITIRNTFVIFLAGGFWHGANWTFIIWGFVNALYLVPSILFGNRKTDTEIVAQNRLLPSFVELFSMLRTFILITLVCIFFRSQDLAHAISFFKGMCSSTIFTLPALRPFSLFVLLLFFVLMEWQGRHHSYAIKQFGFNFPKAIRLAFYCVLVTALFLSRMPEQKFIYFQF